MSAPLFRFNDVVFCYRNVVALDRLNLKIEAGKRIALLGANGCGKSTLLKLLAGLYFPQSGTMEYKGQPLTEHYLEDEQVNFSFRRQLGLVFQDSDAQLFCPTVYDEIAFAPLQLGLPAPEVRERVDSVIDAFGIADLAQRSPHQLSGGEKKRVALACVMVSEPAVLLLDEPTAALDPMSRSRILELLQSWHAPARTLIVASHDLAAVSRITDECLVLKHGRDLEHSSTQRVLSNSALLQEANLIDEWQGQRYSLPL